MIFYFSGCGNSRYVAKAISKELNERLLFIPDEIQKHSEYKFNNDEALGFVFPVYCWAPPRFISNFVRNLKYSGKPAFVYTVCTYGDECGHTYNIFMNDLKKAKLKLDSFYGVQMPETYVNLRGFKLDTIEKEKRKIFDARHLLPEIISRLKKHEKGVRRMKVGSAAFLKSRIIRPFFYASLITDKSFISEDTCSGCGVCARFCPMDNIILLEDRPQWQHKCIGCLSCYHHCPENAIQFGNATKGKGQYYFGRNFKKY